METIGAFPEVETGKILGPTFDAFKPLLDARREEFGTTRMKSFQYGKTERHMLDVYFPEPEDVPTKDAYIVFFVYGGGLTTGDRVFDPPWDVIYTNLGWYFAKKGISTVVLDYRLVPDVQFPGAADDVYEAVKFVLENRDWVVEEAGDFLPFEFNFDNVFLMGHGSGVIHLATALLMPGLLLGSETETRDRVAGVIFVAGTYNTRALPDDDVVVGILAQYWRSLEAMKQSLPQALLQDASEDLVALLPEILIIDAERQPHWLDVGAEDFHKALVERTKRKEITTSIGCRKKGGGSVEAVVNVEPKEETAMDVGEEKNVEGHSSEEKQEANEDGDKMEVGEEKTEEQKATEEKDVKTEENTEETEIELPDIELKTVARLIAKGHNHISMHISPGSGEGEEWTEAVLKWMKTVYSSRPRRID